MTASSEFPPPVPRPLNAGDDEIRTPATSDPVWWSYVSLVARTAIQIGFSAALARILSPADYGMAAMLGTLMAVLSMVGEMGLNWVTIQLASLTSGKVDTLFFFNMISGLGAGICCAASAPLLVAFYHEPRLLWGAHVAAFVFPCAAIAVQPLALMRRALRLKNVFFVEAGSLFAGGLVGIVLAIEWRDYRALIVQGVVTQAIRAVASLWRSGYRPSRPRSIRASLGQLGDGAWMQAFQVFTQVFRSFDNVLIGSRYGAHALGLYARAYYLTTIPSQFTVGTLNESVVPKLSRAWNSSGDFAGTYRRNLKAAAAASIPLAVILACCAPELIYLLYGPKWSGVNRLLAVMSLTTALQPLYNSAYWLLLSTAKFRLMAAIGGTNCVVLLVAFLIGIRGGAIGVAEAYGSAMVLLTITTMAWAHRAVGLSLSVTLTTLKWPAVTSCVLTAILLPIRYLDGRLALNPIAAFALLCTGASLTCVACIVFPVARALIIRGKLLREITIHDIIPEIRRFLGDERYLNRGTAA